LYHFIAVITMTIWGTTYISTKVLICHGLTPVEIIFYRFSMAYVCIWPFSFHHLWAKTLKDELLFVAAGLCGGSLYFLSENTALGMTLASNVSLILCTAPIITAFLYFFLNKGERLKSSLIYGSLMALVGVALVIFNGDVILKINPLGDFLTLLAALMWAIYSLIVKHLGAGYPALLVTRKVFFYGLLTLIPVFPFSPVRFDTTVLSQPEVYGNLIFLGLVASMLCYLMWNAAMKRLGVVRVTNYIYIGPVVTLVASHFLIHERITAIALLGSVFILSGVYMAEKGLPSIKKIQRAVLKQIKEICSS
jgi:drug/metabolite transporter (DMT)-like permease